MSRRDESAKLFGNKYRVDTTRKQNWNYSCPGAYFVTICTKDKVNYFGGIDGEEMILSELGREAVRCWKEIPKHFPFTTLDEFIVMPNHVHGIVVINEKDIVVETQDIVSLRQARDIVSSQSHGAVSQTQTQDLAHSQTQYLASLPKTENKFGPQSRNLASIVRGFKIGVTKYARRNDIDFAWQPRYHDRIIRDERELNYVREYIYINPRKWEFDKNNKANGR